MEMRKYAVILAAGLIALCSCRKEGDLSAGAHIPGENIIFGTSSEGRSLTKTTYSGVTNAQNMERVNWVSGDRIRIYCAEASAATTTNGYSDYSVTGTDKSGTVHAGTIGTDGTSMKWGETQTHVFYSMYPVPGETGVQAGVAMDQNVVTAVLPQDQSFQSAKTNEIGRDYYADMNLAYMTAAATGQLYETGSVTLSFTPIVTTFYVTVKNTTTGTMHVRNIRLSSTQSPLTGTYKASLSPANVRTYTYGYHLPGGTTVFVGKNDYARTDDNSTIEANFSGTGYELGVNESLTVALFAIPEDITGLTLSVNSTENGTASLEIKDNLGQFLTFHGGDKHNLNNIGLPEISYVLDVDPVELSYSYQGHYTDQEFVVESYRTIAGASAASGWKTQIQVGGNWVDLSSVLSDPEYSWLGGFPLTSESAAEATTSLTRTFRKSVDPQEVTSHEQRLREGKVYAADGVTVVDHSTQATAVDLSRYQFTTRQMEASRTTANTYIISGPGYYKIPLVFGNAIENGTRVADSYSGKTGTGHLNEFICPFPNSSGTESSIHLVSTRPWLNAARTNQFRIHWEKYSYWDDTQNQMLTSHRNWGDAAGVTVIDNLSLETGSGNERYLVFHVDENNIRPGNALLATMDQYGNVMWSWQIWITDQDMTPVTINNGTSDYNILPVNLGWVDTNKGQYYGARQAILRFASTQKEGLYSAHTLTVKQREEEITSTQGWSTFYQWGRKDPLTEGTATPKDNDGYVHVSIKHPNNIMYDKSSYWGDRYYDWTINNYNNLWDSKNTAYQNPSGEMPNHKTVYDPSPRKYCVPPDNTWDGFSSYGYSESNADGIYFYTNASQSATTFFPAAGFMNFTSADVSKGDNIENSYWTYHPGESVQRRASYAMTFTHDSANGSTSVVYKSYTNRGRAYGYSVRPVAYARAGYTTEAIFGQAGWTDGEDIVGKSFTSDNVTVSFAKYGIAAGDHPSYSATNEAIVFNRYSEMTISIASGYIADIQLEFHSSDDQSASTSISLYSGGGTYDSGHWYANNNAGVLDPQTSTVVLRTGLTGNARVISSITVTYQPI